MAPRRTFPCDFGHRGVKVVIPAVTGERQGWQKGDFWTVSTDHRMAVHRRRSPPALDPPPPTLQTKVTIVGKNESYHWENRVGPFLVHTLLGPRAPSLFSSKTSLPPTVGSSVPWQSVAEAQ